MFVEIEEMKSVLYEYNVDEIVHYDEEIIIDGILAAIAEVKGYFYAANARRETAGLSKQEYAKWKLYDVDAIFNASGSQRNNFVMRLVKRVAAYNIVELDATEQFSQKVTDHYNATIATLEKIAGAGEWANSRIVLPDLPTLQESESESDATAHPFRMVSRKKFNHE